MIWFFTPYSFNKRMFEAWDSYMFLVKNTDDWVCMMDGDIAFLHSDFGHHIEKYISKYPDTGLFTCYSSRSRTPWMMPAKNFFSSPSIVDHKILANHLYETCHLSVTPINDRVTGHLMVMKKMTWLKIRDAVHQKTAGLKILSVDSVISREILSSNLKIRLMQGIYVFHYYRFLEGAASKKHLV